MTYNIVSYQRPKTPLMFSCCSPFLSLPLFLLHFRFLFICLLFPPLNFCKGARDKSICSRFCLKFQSRSGVWGVSRMCYVERGGKPSGGSCGYSWVNRWDQWRPWDPGLQMQEVPGQASTFVSTEMRGNNYP